MPLTVLEMQKTHLLGLRAEQLDALLRGWGWPDFRANQLREWVYSRQVSDPAAMTGPLSSATEPFGKTDVLAARCT